VDGNVFGTGSVNGTLKLEITAVPIT